MNSKEDFAYEVTGKEALKLINSGDAILRNDLRMPNDDMFEYYLLKDGRLLLYFKYEPSGTIYKSYQKLVDVMKANEEKRKKRFPGKKLKDGNEQLDYYHFEANHLLELVKATPGKLADVLHVKLETLDYSVQSLTKLSDGINKLLDTTGRNEVFDLIGQDVTLYFGEVMRIAIKGTWNVVSDKNGNLKAMDIIDPIIPEKKYKPYEMLIEGFLNTNEPINLKSDFDIELRHFGSQ